MKFFWSYLRNSAQKAVTELQKGFSLVELVVAVSILIILTLTFLFSYSSFDRRVTVDILAHQIAVWIHDAQVSAMSVRRAANEQEESAEDDRLVKTADAPRRRHSSASRRRGRTCGACSAGRAR